MCKINSAAHGPGDMGHEEKRSADLMTYSGFLSSSLPGISLKRSMFEVPAYVIVCLSVGGGAGGAAEQTEGRIPGVRTCDGGRRRKGLLEIGGKVSEDG